MLHCCAFNFRSSSSMKCNCDHNRYDVLARKANSELYLYGNRVEHSIDLIFVHDQRMNLNWDRLFGT